MVVVRYLFLALVGGSLWASQLSAQTPPTGSLSGRVVDSTTQQPVPDVAIVIEGTPRGTVTRSDGSFVLNNVPAGPVRVRARRIGYSSPVQAVTVPAGGTATVQFALGGRVAILEEVVTTGYGTQRRAAITGSVSTIDATAADVGIPTNVSQMIEGRAPGVSITQNSGEPGAGAQIRIRGGTSISASNEPLYVVDGVPIPSVEPEDAGIGIGGTPPLPRSPMNFINPSDIASITILKDAAASIYGTRAANGVILIETKKGIAGASSMEYEFQAATSSPYQYLNLLNGDEYRAFIQDQVAKGILASTRLADLGTANTDWERAVTRTASTFNHNLSFAGGSAATQYRASLNYMSQNGVVLSSGFKRYQARLNGTHNTLGNRLRLGLNLTGSQLKNDYLPYENTGGFEGGVFINMVNFNPTQPVSIVDPSTGQNVFFEIGPGSQSVRNPVALADQIQDFGTSTLFLGNVSAALDLAQSLTATVSAGVDRTDGLRRTYFPRISPVGAQTSGDARQATRDNTALNLQTVLTFHPQFSSSHDIDILGGYEYNDNTLSLFGAETRGFLTDAFGFNNLSSGSVVLPPFSYLEYSRLVSFFSRANYSWNDQFFLTGSLRRDGSSRFGAGNKWAVFPAISGSWRFSEGGMIPRGPFSNLTLRAGYGLLGNPAVPPYASLILLSADAGSRYVFGELPVTGVSPIRNPNPNLKWETTAATNVALDYGFNNNRFTGTVEYYVKNTHDLILEVPVPQPAVIDTRLENIGKVRNRGLEFSLNAQMLNRPERNWKTGVVLAVERNTVVDLGGRSFISTGGVSGQGQSGQTSQRIIPGEPIGTFYGPEFVGLNAQGQQLFNQYKVTRDSTGRETSRELTGTTTNPGGDDKVVIGNANPDFSLGFNSQANWGKIDFSFLVHAEQGQDVFNATALVYATKSNALQSKNFLASALNDGVDIHEPQIYSSRWIEDGSFVRLQNVTLGYTFDLPKSIGVARSARAYVSADNLLLITGYSGYDPEVHTESGLVSRGIDYLHYPRPRTFTGGIRVAF
jgi:TonB-linked SusC/RagA family outer membrane protein